MTSNKLNLYYKAIGITNLGIGKRAVYWLQGCSFGCDGCLAIDSHSHKIKNYYDCDKLIDELKPFNNELEGVTISGGEPFEQKENLLYFIKKIKEKYPKFSIMLFTGFTLEQILEKKDEYFNKILSYLDIIIDGKFKKEKRINEPWRGSSNQNIYFLTNRYSIEDYKKEKIGIDYLIKDNEIFEVGIPMIDKD